MVAVMLGDCSGDALPLGGPAVQAGHGQIHPGFVDTFQAPGSARGHPLPVARTGVLDAWRLAFGGMEGLFFSR